MEAYNNDTNTPNTQIDSMISHFTWVNKSPSYISYNQRHLQTTPYIVAVQDWKFVELLR